MDARKAIEQAKVRLMESRDLNAHLNFHKYVKVPILNEVSPYVPVDPADIPATPTRADYVIFTLEETAFGLRLMADYQGYKEFAA